MRTNVLLNTYAFHEPWAQSALTGILHPTMRVTVVAFSFNAGMDEMQAASEGHRRDLLPAFAAYGIPQAQIELVNWFRDTPETARKKIRNSDVLFFTGGWPDHMMYRLHRWGLVELIESFDGIVMGCSAGAMVQVQDYHITPDADYSDFGYYHGMKMLDRFDIEVHYKETELQHRSIHRVLREKKRPVIAVYNDGGVIVRGDQISTMGRVRLFLLPEGEHAHLV